MKSGYHKNSSITKKDEKFDQIVYDLQNRITTLVAENERLSQIVKRNTSRTDALDNSLR